MFLLIITFFLILFSRICLAFHGRSGLLYLADAMLVGIALFYIVRFYYSNVTDATVERPSQFIFKLFIFALFVNFSYFFVEQFINILYLLTSSVQAIGKEVTGLDVSFSELIVCVNDILSVESDDFNFFSFDGIIKSFVTFGLVNLLILYSVRYILIQVLILFTPFAILSLINSTSSWIFKTWFRSILSLMLVQLFIALALIVVFIVKDSKLLLIGGVYALSKINDYIREMFGGISFNVSTNFSSIMSMIKK